MSKTMPTRLTVRLTPDEIEALLLANGKFTQECPVECDDFDEDLHRHLKSARVALIAATKVATAKTHRKDPRDGKA